MAHSDELTGLPNRALFSDRLEQTIAQARRNHGRFALLFADLDGFKAVNDRHGHLVGDELLRAVADRLVSGVRESNTVARLGGDEFILILNDLNNWEGPAVVARKLLESLSVPFDLGGVVCRIGASIGVSIYPEDAEDAEGLVSCADFAMYEVKQKGGNDFLYSSRRVGAGGSGGKS